MKARVSGYALVVVAAVLWGTLGIFFRRADIDPRWAAPLSFTTASLVGLPLLRRAGARNPRKRTRREWAWLVALGLADAANSWFLFQAFSRTAVSVTVLSQYLAPALVALLAPLILRSALRGAAVLRALVALAGLCLLLRPWTASGAGALEGAAFGVGSALFFASTLCISKALMDAFTPEEQIVYHGAIAALVLLPLAPWGALPALHGVAWTALGSIVGGLVAGLLFLRGLRAVPAEHASVIAFAEPLTAVVVGACLFDEALTALSIVGAVVIVGCGVHATWADRPSPRSSGCADEGDGAVLAGG
ncbi:MAG: DMT family transporter [Polyangiaceae bacterium]